ncbi:hypothetical protein KKF34_06505 [Myxococcota bacterium]|nr:hypothetical protein [Myxococcota bacterium]MBU1381667.1 hypothetical protein [Myxococcota bacterium]MBU1496510.1 hypothetical protein [Myxococcota bacterium]
MLKVLIILIPIVFITACLETEESRDKINVCQDKYSLTFESGECHATPTGDCEPMFRYEYINNYNTTSRIVSQCKNTGEETILVQYDEIPEPYYFQDPEGWFRCYYDLIDETAENYCSLEQ